MNKLEEYSHVFQGKWSPETGLAFGRKCRDDHGVNNT